MVESMAGVSHTALFGGQTPMRTDSARMRERSSRLAQGQMWTMRGGPSTA